METYKTGLKFKHIEDVDKNLAEKIRNIVRLNAFTVHNKDKTFSMRLYKDPDNRHFPSVTSVFPKGKELRCNPHTEVAPLTTLDRLK